MHFVRRNRVHNGFVGLLAQLFEHGGCRVVAEPAVGEKKPDLLVFDPEGPECYVEAFVYYRSRDPNETNGLVAKHSPRSPGAVVFFESLTEAPPLSASDRTRLKLGKNFDDRLKRKVRRYGNGILGGTPLVVAVLDLNTIAHRVDQPWRDPDVVANFNRIWMNAGRESSPGWEHFAGLWHWSPYTNGQVPMFYSAPFSDWELPLAIRAFDNFCMAETENGPRLLRTSGGEKAPAFTVDDVLRNKLEIWQRRSPNMAGFLNRDDLRERGWTYPLMSQFLPEPDKRGTNKQARLWSIFTVREIEADPEVAKKIEDVVRMRRLSGFHGAIPR